ncbi:hypothetical protein SAG0321_08955 [Streptococcus agalactiae GB00247]|nr:hypothetical protein SAG0066_08890 [Streptococcus agalactiae CCUG 38383]EPU50910.1 hypothetical protein SAG0300_03425 [Streptococcus agalactiae GB00002]EPU78906.1 hypothetical protein SAG0314_03470 [Streptococcus agalactiae GB00190]EPU92198.1 hypothetical protein SAG0320_06475 [Streptococcus agalactiae GB00245]EPU97205.1 hypothetical protein SAG0321_08955 [Streptococcus agalactiae GB00247]EPV18425.1 hypothetical protein SAG0332_05580 [Streptococcus agalactiae GB00601]EPV34345.1 hypothetica
MKKQVQLKRFQEMFPKDWKKVHKKVVKLFTKFLNML